MQAIVYHEYGPPDVLEVAEVRKPAPQEHEVLIKVHAASVTSTDNTMRQGEPFVARLFMGLTRPKQAILGTEFAGEIEAVGSAVTRFSPGDQVFAASGANFGAHAEYLCLPETGALAPKPPGISYAEAVAICEGGLTALPFLRDHGKIRRGQKVLINGASGSVGTAAVQLAKYFGAEVTGVCSTANVDLVRSLGADTVVDYTQEDFTGNGQVYDVIFDAVGKSSFSRCRGVLADTGIYLTTVATPTAMLQNLWTSRFGSRRAVLAFTGLRPDGDKSKDLVFLGELAEAGQIKAVIERCYPFAQAAEAHRHVHTGHKKGNVVITMELDPIG